MKKRNMTVNSYHNNSILPFRDSDVLFFKGSTPSQRPADSHFRNLIVMNSILYSALPKDGHLKRTFAGNLYEYLVKVENRRLLHRLQGTGNWILLDSEAAIEKIMARFREKWVKQEVSTMPWPLFLLLNEQRETKDRLTCVIKTPQASFVRLESLQDAGKYLESGCGSADMILVSCGESEPDVIEPLPFNSPSMEEPDSQLSACDLNLAFLEEFPLDNLTIRNPAPTCKRSSDIAEEDGRPGKRQCLATLKEVSSDEESVMAVDMVCSFDPTELFRGDSVSGDSVVAYTASV